MIPLAGSDLWDIDLNDEGHDMAKYEATHQDPLTVHLRATNWRPITQYKCGCDVHKLCQQHATIRAAEHYHPELAR